MKRAQSQPFFFEAGKRAVLLLHGFTGSSADVRMLGRFLEKNGYTCHAPHYKGHGVPPEELLGTNPEDWWRDVLAGYNFLREKGYEEIAVAGLSLGGVFSLKLGLNFPVKGIVTMCAPMTMRTTDIMFAGVLDYAKQYKKQEGKDEAQIETELQAIREQGMPSLTALQQLVQNVHSEIDLIYAPIFVVQATHDAVINANSANMIYNGVESLKKSIKWYEHSGHVITLDKEKDQLHEDVYAFLQSLDWNV
ncbi:carboxylesterase [Solibacillus sp. CAU 1738]|uniref:alpha/beta hydrolase n=1 Tax=Solibacillus sp. CAU 1738 TaxID=3140363 RepID=UPI0032603369